MPTQAELAAYCASGANCPNCKYPDCIFDGSTLQDFHDAHRLDVEARIAEKDHRGRKLAAQQRAYREANKERWKTIYAENRRKKGGQARDTRSKRDPSNQSRRLQRIQQVYPLAVQTP